MIFWQSVPKHQAQCLFVLSLGQLDCKSLAFQNHVWILGHARSADEHCDRQDENSHEGSLSRTDKIFNENGSFAGEYESTANFQFCPILK